MRKRRFQRLSEMVSRDPRLTLTPASTQATWMRLEVAMELLHTRSLPGKDRAARRAEVLAVARISEAGLQAELPALLRFGLMRQRRDGALIGPAPLRHPQAFPQEAR